MLGGYSYKDSERTGGLNHLNGLFVIFMPSDVRIPTNLQKTFVDVWFKDVVTKTLDEVEEIWEPTDVTGDITRCFKI